MALKFIKSNIKLTIGMLVSNHKQYIRKAMEALKPLLDAVPSELVVIDTMGDETDGSIDIVREYTDKIYPFTWCNDFSAARNFCLDHANGEWFMYQDDDEYFDDVQEFIDFFNSGECNKYNAGFYKTRDYLTEGGYSEGVAGRMIHRQKNTRFVGKVHETFNEVYAPNKMFSCFTHHYGYVYADREEMLKKQKRNLDILKQEIEEGGITPRWAAQYVLELTGDDSTKEEAYQKAMEYIPQLNAMGEILDSCSQWLLTATVRHFSGKETYQQQLEQADYIRKTYSLTQTAELVLASTVLVTAVEAEDFETAVGYADLYLKNYDWYQTHEKEAIIQVQLDFPGFLCEDFHHQILHLAAKAANQMEDFDKANQYWKRMPWKKEGFNARCYEEDLNKTVRGMREAKERQYDEKVKSLAPLVEILAEASVQVKNDFSTGNMTLAKQYLAGMQEAAISLGTSLDNLIGEGSTTVVLLEQYCELLWNCNTAERAEDGLALAEVLCEATKLISESFVKETRRKKTILLMPKRGSEWYLFEPYWKEAKENGDRVIVIPVPCYDKHVNGMRGEEIYGDEKYPEELELLDYKKYNYSGFLADLIVVKDDYNSEQTFYTVHPFFYIDNLKQYTKKLEVVSEWDGGIGELERQMEALRKLVEEAKQSR